MVVIKTVERRWYRRYRTFFLLGTIILSFQLYLALKFLPIHSETIDEWNTRKISLETHDFDNSANSARRAKDGFLIDDEDTLINDHHEVKLMRAEKPNPTHFLRLDELDFVPACEITTKEAASAIHRARTQNCKRELVNVTCLAQNGSLYPAALPNYCPSGGFKAGKALGCFKDTKNFRLLNGYFVNFKMNNSPEHCIRMCLQSGFPYAGVQYATECFCGNEEPPSEARLPDSSCNMKCPADPHLACGGYFTINIYETGIAKFTPQIAKVNDVKNTKPVRIVFLLTLNGRAVRQVRRLIKILFHKRHYFYIHVDARQDYLFRELLQLETQFTNIRLTRQRFSTIWGGASLLQMLLTSMQELLSLEFESNWHWDFVINLSESDYPVKTLKQLEDFLNVNRDRNFVKSHGREVQRFIQKQGLDKTFVECDTHMWRQGDRILPWGIQIDGGSDWIALSKSFVQYVADPNPDDLIHGLKIVFKYTLLPAESFFHTVLRNSRFCSTYIDNNLHVTNWKRKLGCKCQYKHVVDWCGCSPNDFKPDDWLKIQATESKQLFFARKFEPVINQAIVLQVEEWLYGPREVKNLHNYWQSVYHYADLTSGPEPDDANISIGNSLIRIVTKLFKMNSIPVQLFEITSYHESDNYAGTLILFGNESVRFETWFQPRDTLILYKTTLLAQRLQSLTVSSDWDQKEQTFRNFARVLGPFSDPVLVYEFLPSLAFSKQLNLTFLWIDPRGELVDVSRATIDENYALGYLKLSVKPPLCPGTWTVKLIHKQQLISQTIFLITPLEFMSNTALSQTQLKFIHSGTPNGKEFVGSGWDVFLESEETRASLFRKSVANSKRFDSDLHEWIDGLVDKFYRIKRTCVLNNVNQEFKLLEKCGETSWSSVTSDPKSLIGNVNETTGYLNSIW